MNSTITGKRRSPAGVDRSRKWMRQVRWRTSRHTTNVPDRPPDSDRVPNGIIRRAAELNQAGDYEEVIELLRHVPEDDEAVWSERGLAYLGMDDPEAATGAFDRARAIQQFHLALTLCNLSTVRMAADDIDYARTCAQRARDLYPCCAAPHLALLTICERTVDVEAFERVVAEMHRLWPGSMRDAQLKSAVERDVDFANLRGDARRMALLFGTESR